MVEFLRTHAVRVYALVVAVLALVVHYVPGLPSELVLGVVAAVLGVAGGEVVQRVEDRKTVDADSLGYAEGLAEGVDVDGDGVPDEV